MASTPTLTPVHGSSEKGGDSELGPQPPESLKGFRKAAMLFFLCSAQFFDIFNAVSTITGLPVISRNLHFAPGALQWVVTAYTLTFATFLLFAGRLSDIYDPKPVFTLGYVAVGVFSILCGVSVHPIMLLIFRAMQGIGAAMTFPSALAMIMQHFPDPKEQGRALAIFGAFGAVGNVSGFILGGVLAARVSWRWIFYLVAIVVIPFSILSMICLPSSPSSARNKERKLDWQGVVALAGGLILFVYAVSEGNSAGWNTPQILVTLVFSVIFVVGFFFIERSVKDPAVPPRTWSNQNFLPLFLYSWTIYWSLNGAEFQLVQIFQDLWGWSALSAALHCIPIGVSGGVFSYLTGVFAPHMPRRILLIGGQLAMLVGAVLYSLADTPNKYWRYVLPGMTISLMGTAMAYVGANIFIMAGSRKGEEGVVGAMMNTAFQLGATVGLAIITAITLGVNKNQPSGPLSQYKGYQASFWSTIGLHGVAIIMSVIFVK